MNLNKKDLSILTVAANENTNGGLVLYMIQSVRKFTGTDIEIIVVDNGNNDKVLNKIQDEKVKIIKNIDKQRSSKSTSIRHGSGLNCGIKHIKTPYCAIIETDCVVLSDNWYNMDTSLYDIKAAHKGKRDVDYWFLCFLVFKTDIFKSMSWMPQNRKLSGNKYNDTGWQMGHIMDKNRIHNVSVCGSNKKIFVGREFSQKTIEFVDGDCTIAAHFFRGSDWERRDSVYGKPKVQVGKWRAICRDVLK